MVWNPRQAGKDGSPAQHGRTPEHDQRVAPGDTQQALQHVIPGKATQGQPGDPGAGQKLEIYWVSEIELMQDGKSPIGEQDQADSPGKPRKTFQDGNTACAVLRRARSFRLTL